MNNTAFLVIDVQAGMFPEADPVYQGELLLEKIQSLIHQARTCNVPVLYVQHNEGPGEQLESGTADWEIHPAIAPESGETIIQKYKPDSFHETDLQEVLGQKGIKSLIIAGIQTDMCVEATTKRASELGYEVTVVQDAHSTWSQGGLSAKDIIDQYNEQFHSYARLAAASDIMFHPVLND
ncbi:cysteine hydrolase family protein [Paenibacillus dokdonensis]|uniref:Cysteine hydrolase family protein n=1 Tax=Paenibacillus dokdonensis TaxID=2567944 RepID=A0ABU6GSY8_9BACL|nr:cysteine hydrolase family protein [Paenibacillus dokdonensis]MEC0242474.1 cysteine hydrolase family protein [Paenibacillus dokdonensis]